MMARRRNRVPTELELPWPEVPDLPLSSDFCVSGASLITGVSVFTIVFGHKLFCFFFCFLATMVPLVLPCVPPLKVGP